MLNVSAPSNRKWLVNQDVRFPLGANSAHSESEPSVIHIIGSISTVQDKSAVQPTAAQPTATEGTANDARVYQRRSSRCGRSDDQADSFPIFADLTARELMNAGSGGGIAKTPA